jgi:hypothetical protein
VAIQRHDSNAGCYFTGQWPLTFCEDQIDSMTPLRELIRQTDHHFLKPADRKMLDKYCDMLLHRVRLMYQ